MAAILGTLQAGYTDFKYLGEVTEKIVRHEALLGCSITGMMDNPDILFSPANQRKAAEIIKDTNRKVAKMIGINPAARTTCCKPAGTTSCVLGTASGIHPHHAKRYIRRVQANRLEFPLRKFTEVNPLAVNESVWSENKTDMVISFLCEVPAGAVTKNMMSALDLLDKVKTTQQNWVEYGTNKELCIDNTLRHNVSNTITVQPDEWDQVTKYIYRNRQWFAAISLLPASGDKDYPQAPFTTVHTPIEMAKEYGDASVLASGVIVDGLKAFDDLWPACDAALGKGAPLPELPKEPKYPTKRDNKDLAQYFNDKEAYETILLKHDWVRRARQFADRYLDGDVQKMTYCLKDVNNWKTWCDLRREYKEVDWSTVVEDEPFYIDINTTAAQACQGGKCEL
jgi:ribonucleoside-diphosphate reductase alpha chain